MPRRTLSEARQILEGDILPRVSDHQAKEARQVLEAAERRAETHAEEFINAREEEIRMALDDSLRELATVRDEMEDLAARGRTGRVPASDYADELRDLRQRQDAAEAKLRKAEEIIARVERIEGDPLGWFDDLARRSPHIRPEVPW